MASAWPKWEPTSDRCFIARESGEPSKMGKRKTAQAGALIDDAAKWKGVDWKHARHEVRGLQMRIAKAVNEGRWNKVKSLQNLLSRSFYAKLLAVKRVTSNKGKKTEVTSAGAPHKGVLLKCLSRVRGNSHARFLGGKGAVTPPPYPVLSQIISLFYLQCVRQWRIVRYGVRRDACVHPGDFHSPRNSRCCEDWFGRN